ncbi:ApeP family dehydratase [Vibrio agarivorans]|uniref:ApeP family dehydratase n=1 Tax=Vibrio agarivorans TaxID=153622 RepID=UPI00223181B6|nr:3-hydroxydecanoyl-ACP dehydratase [Vibrio agarivorans]
MKQKVYPPIEALLPHSHPMILIDSVVQHTNNMVECEFTISPKSFLFDSLINGVPAQAGVEYMAQTIAALGGLASYERGEAPSIGFLLGARRYHHRESCFLNGHRYLVHAQELMSDSSVAVYQCKILNDKNQEVASGQVNTVVASSSMLNALINNTEQ